MSTPASGVLSRELGFSPIPRAKPEATDGIVELDFERDRGLWDPNDGRFTLDAVGIVRERYGVSPTVAKRTLAHHQTLPMFDEGAIVVTDVVRVHTHGAHGHSPTSTRILCRCSSPHIRLGPLRTISRVASV
jgi:hypothetical protein